RVERRRRIARADDIDVHRNFLSRRSAGAGSILVDNRHRAEDDSDTVAAGPRAQLRDERGIRASSDLELVRDLAGEGRKAGSPGADEQRHFTPNDGVPEAVAGSEREAPSAESPLVARDEPTHDLPCLADRGEGERRVDP